MSTMSSSLLSTATTTVTYHGDIGNVDSLLEDVAL